MPEVKRLVPVDGSPPSCKATDYAAKMAGLMTAELLLVHSHKPFPSVLGEPYLQKAITQRLENSQKLLTPYREMIVMGSQGRTDLQGLLLGSTAHRVLHCAHCPVLVVT